MEMLDLEADRIGTKIVWPKGICTVEATIHLIGRRMTLSELYQHLFGDSFAGAHRARRDVEALVRCCVELKKRDLV